jgi:hypothetical protein
VPRAAKQGVKFLFFLIPKGNQKEEKSLFGERKIFSPIRKGIISVPGARG